MSVDVNMIEVKKTKELSAKPASSNAKEATVKSAQWQNALGDIKDEFSKISWTSPAELLTYTRIVVIGTVAFGMGIYFMDLTIQTVLGGLSALMRLIGG